ncbi:MAG: VCBS repeat-containing protein [Chitinophagaceae bacterium]|nr:VCBS repeat-containing protein [Chitinophagaceae bacterium]
MKIKFLTKNSQRPFLKLQALALFALANFTAIAQDVTAGSNFNLCGRAATGIYSTRPTNANFSTGTGEIVTDIVATTNTGDAIDFDNDGFAEVVLRTIGNNSTTATQTRVYIFEASENNNYSRVAIQLVDAGTNNASVGLSKGLDVGNIDGDADVEIVVFSGASTSTFLTAYDISSLFAVTELAQSRLYGFTGSTDAIIVNGNIPGTINTVKIVPSKNGNANADIIFSQATGTTTHLAAVEFNNTAAFTWLTSGAMANYNGGIYAFNVADMDADGDLEIIMLCETATSSLRIREYSTNATDANRFGTADLTVTGNWNATATGGQAYTNIAIADIDNDGDLEAVCPDFQNKTIKVVTFDGANYVATTAVDLVAANSIPLAVAVGDLDNDGFQELYYSRVNSANVTLREHNGVANAFANSNFPNFLTVLSGLGTDNEATALALNTLNNSADKDNNFDLFVGRGNNVTDTDLDGDEFFVVEINRLFGGGFGVGGVGATPTVISGGFYDNITTDGTVGLSGTVQVNGILRIRNGSLNFSHGYLF